MELIEITLEGLPASEIHPLSDIAADVLRGTTEMYQAIGYQPPWVGYLALVNGDCVGTCAFKGPPVDGRVEIAYFTFPGNEGRGIAIEMAKHLVEKALADPQPVRICAQTLPERNSSTRILEKIGFERIAELDHPEDGKVWEWEWKGSKGKSC